MQSKLLYGVTLAVSLFAVHFAGAQEATAAGNAEAGEHLFKQSCSACHSTEPEKKIVGPSLHAELKGHPPKKTAAQVRTIINNGNGTMPAFKNQLAPADIENLIAYLKTQ
jgi:mono/diheme cytochrome c family protein